MDQMDHATLVTDQMISSAKILPCSSAQMTDFFLQNTDFFFILHSIRARPDWAYEFPDRTGPDTQICRTGPAGLDSIRTYIFEHFTM